MVKIESLKTFILWVPPCANKQKKIYSCTNHMNIEVSQGSVFAARGPVVFLTDV